jgi:hypothetical protein
MLLSAEDLTTCETLYREFIFRRDCSGVAARSDFHTLDPRTKVCTTPTFSHDSITGCTSILWRTNLPARSCSRWQDTHKVVCGRALSRCSEIGCSQLAQSRAIASLKQTFRSSEWPASAEWMSLSEVFSEDLVHPTWPRLDEPLAPQMRRHSTDPGSSSHHAHEVARENGGIRIIGLHREEAN